ncbi:MAG: M24 family metallopeptidase [Candidatus Altiarchaeales archaeon]|nr:M24 family metallopeptidase [Candidatus Altiarchaeales archaeon]MBD3416837.1 M24 family metallopeptidase [Candidatus Altiarchaeales archaeon]
MIKSAELRRRLSKVRGEMRRERLTALYVNKDFDAFYLSGKDTGRILITKDSAILWVKDVYYELYESTYSMRGYPLEVRVHDESDLKRTLRCLRSKSIGVSSAEYVAPIRKASRKKVVVSASAKSARSVKTKEEIDRIRRSARIAKLGMRKAREVVDVGVRELDAVAEIEAELRRRGSERPPFDCGMLLASGKRSADIHARPSNKRISRGPVVVDLGAVYRGYHSDMTRTLSAGSLNSDERRVSDLIRRLRDETIDLIRPGIQASSVHKYVDESIKAAGYNFHHLSGHGVGLEIHEGPNFRPGANVRLKPGMVFTVEPGIYLPRRFGVRFEDTVLLTRRGCKKLT